MVREGESARHDGIKLTSSCGGRMTRQPVGPQSELGKANSAPYIHSRSFEG